MKKDYDIGNFFASAEYIVENAYMYAWECDIFIQMKSGYHYEIEKKISRSDFKADFKKSAKHFQLENHKKELITIPGSKNYSHVTKEQYENFGYDKYELFERETYRNDILINSANNVYFRQNKLPNRFFYITPKGLLNENEIPFYAGLLEYENGEIKQIKSAKWLHKNKYNYDKILLQKYYYRYLNIKNENRMLKNSLGEFDRIYENQKNNYTQIELEF